MKPAVEPADIPLPGWLKPIGEDRIKRIQTRISQIHNSLLGTANWGYAPFREAFDAIAIELSEDPEFGERFYIRIRTVVVDLARELEWIRPEWLTPFDPSRALPEIDWLGSILGRRPGEPWRGAYTKEWASKRLLTSRQAGEAEDAIRRVEIKERSVEVLGEPADSSRFGHQADVSAQLRPVLDVKLREQKRGPKPNYGIAELVAELVHRVAGDGSWLAKLDEICDALEEAKVPHPKTWEKRGHKDWYDALVTERSLVVKAITHHLKLNEAQRKTLG
jgi:hypothetical protein